MAYTKTTNVLPGKILSRPPLEQAAFHRWFIAHVFSNELGTAAKSLNALIEDNSNLAIGLNQDHKRLPCRTHVEITNTHSTAVVYVAYHNALTSQVFTWKLAPGGYLKEPLGYDADLFLISDTASTSLLINEVG